MERRGRQHRHLGNNKKKEAAAAAEALFQLDFVPRKRFAECVFMPFGCRKSTARRSAASCRRGVRKACKINTRGQVVLVSLQPSDESHVGREEEINKNI